MTGPDIFTISIIDSVKGVYSFKNSKIQNDPKNNSDYKELIASMIIGSTEYLNVFKDTLYNDPEELPDSIRHGIYTYYSTD